MTSIPSNTVDERERERDSVYRKANADITLYNVVDVPMAYKRE